MLHLDPLISEMAGEEEKSVRIELKTYGPREEDGPVILVTRACCTRDAKSNITGVCFISQDVTGEKLIMDKYNQMHVDYDGIVRSSFALVPPIFMMDQNGRCSEWNDAMQKLTGTTREEALDRMLLGEVFTVSDFGCRVKDQDTLTKLRILLNGALAGEDADKLLFGFFDQQGEYIEALISSSRRTDGEGRITGVLCFLHITSPELQYAMQMQRLSEQAAENSLTRLSYIRQGFKNPLNGIKCLQNLMKSSNLSKEQYQLLKTSTLCRKQLTKILDDTGFERNDECYMDVSTGEFNLWDAVEAVMNQVMILSRERQVQIIIDSPSDVSSTCLYGDTSRLQQVLSDFLKSAVLFTPAFEGSSVLFRIILRKEKIGSNIHIVHAEFRITHPAPGIPDDLIQEMFYQGQNANASREGLCLYISQKLVKIMNGNVQYLREAERSSFIILVEFPLVHRSSTDERQ